IGALSLDEEERDRVVGGEAVPDQQLAARPGLHRGEAKASCMVARQQEARPAAAEDAHAVENDNGLGTILDASHVGLRAGRIYARGWAGILSARCESRKSRRRDAARATRTGGPE